ncbi:MAG: hypothetical protein LBQ35_04555, partial [Spirochaetaceae bacterium]|nr:hypothetical protein [Spirochaetaceae bacterium]
YSSGPYKIAGSASNTKATVFYSAAEGKIKEGYGSGMNEAVADPAIDWEFVTLFTNLQVNDTFTVNNLGVLTAASFEVLPAALDNFTTVLSFVPAVTLNVDYAPDRDVTIPAGPVKFSIAAGKTLTVAAGRALTLAENAVVALTGTGSITLTNDDVLPGRIIFAGNGARLNAGGSGSGRITGAGGVLAPAGSVDQNKIPVSSFTDLVITGGNNTLSSIAYGGGVKPCVTGPKNSAGSSAKISASTDCM